MPMPETDQGERKVKVVNQLDVLIMPVSVIIFALGSFSLLSEILGWGGLYRDELRREYMETAGRKITQVGKAGNIFDIRILPSGKLDPESAILLNRIGLSRSDRREETLDEALDDIQRNCGSIGSIVPGDPVRVVTQKPCDSPYLQYSH